MTEAVASGGYASSATSRCASSAAFSDATGMLAPDAYLRLVHDAGWPVEQFEAWLADLLQRMFLE